MTHTYQWGGDRRKVKAVTSLGPFAYNANVCIRGCFGSNNVVVSAGNNMEQEHG